MSNTGVCLRSSAVGRTAALLAALLVTLSLAACRPAVDIASAVRVERLSTGWLDVSDTNKSKVVPALTVTLTNVSSERLRVLQVNAHFHTSDDEDEWGSGFRTVVGSEGLKPGATSTVTLKGEWGYTGRGVQRMVSQFAETKVELYAKYAAERWTPLGEYTISRELVR